MHLQWYKQDPDRAWIQCPVGTYVKNVLSSTKVRNVSGVSWKFQVQCVRKLLHIFLPTCDDQCAKHTEDWDTLSGASNAAVENAQQWQCPICMATGHPKRPMKATTRMRPLVLATLCVDWKYSGGFQENRHVALSSTCAGTMFHRACLVKTRIPKKGCQDVSYRRGSHHGVPKIVVVNERGEFESTVAQECEDRGSLISHCWKP